MLGVISGMRQKCVMAAPSALDNANIASGRNATRHMSARLWKRRGGWWRIGGRGNLSDSDAGAWRAKRRERGGGMSAKESVCSSSRVAGDALALQRSR